MVILIILNYYVPLILKSFNVKPHLLLYIIYFILKKHIMPLAALLNIIMSMAIASKIDLFNSS